MIATLTEAAAAVQGTISGGPDNIRFNGVSTDTRTLQKGQLYVALSGERFDGHAFLAQAFEKGAAAAIVSKPAEGYPVILVQDTLAALQRLAAYHRSCYHIPVIAVTGSVGKTTTKDLLAACLEGQYNTLKTQGNLNNEIGVPLTLLRLGDEHRVCVVEMGMRALGEIELLASMTRPTGAVIVNVDAVHLETLGSVADVARAKCEVLPYTEDFAALDGDSPELAGASGASRTYRFGRKQTCDWRVISAQYRHPATIVDLRIEDESIRVELPLPAVHLASNIAAAVGVARLLGVSTDVIRRQLLAFRPHGGRLQIGEGIRDSVLIDDCYNASPRSMIAAVEALAAFGGSGRKIAILGDMFELGGFECEGHRSVGRAVALNGVDLLVTVGEKARWIAAGARDSGFRGTIRETDDAEAALAVIKPFLQANDVVWVKASRGMKLERIAQALTRQEES